MRNNRRRLSSVGVYSTAIVFALSGCATPGGGKFATSSSETGGCNPVAMAAVGAIFGALLAGKNNRNQGAIIGGTVGGLACVAWNYKVAQIRTAEQVNNAYKAANSGALPFESTLVRYSVNSVPSSILNSGNPLILDSKIEVVQGSNGARPVVEQELIITHDGKIVSKAKKVANLGLGAGEYQVNFQLNLPKGVPQGDYPVYTAIYIDGKKVRENNIPVQVVLNDLPVQTFASL